ncbi:MAG: peptide chain release factor N(5)-glutamine methyltransferase [Deltaproteobacteria bacterium]|nr:peptide chain release factor N(5)-glutamine methyltransferase [Deltaproteobacteria bacterium]
MMVFTSIQSQVPVFKNMLAIAEKNWTIKETLAWAEDYLNRYEVPDAKVEAEYLLTHLLGCKRSKLYLNYSDVMACNELQQYIDFIERRIKREPSQYIIGEQGFWGLSFKVNKDVLIPRPETEVLVEEAVNTVNCKLLNVNGRKEQTNSISQCTVHGSQFAILDLCTGSGCIAISIAKEIPDCQIYAVDIAERALDVARENAERNGVADKITFLNGNLFEPLRGLNLKADLIVSNPPYISKKMMKELQPEVKDYEPQTALCGGDDGLDFYRRIIAEAPNYLTKRGHLILEMGYGQAEEIKKLIKQNKTFEHIDIKKDIAGIDRVIKARRKD